MKKMFLIIALVVAGLTVKAQNSKDVPSNVTSSLNSKFPDAKKVDWERTGVNYKAEFSMGEMDYEVVFDTQGNWLSTEVDDIQKSEIPTKIQKGLDNSEYKNWEVGTVESTETSKETTYKVGVRKGVKMRELYFNEEGSIIRDKGKM